MYPHWSPLTSAGGSYLQSRVVKPGFRGGGRTFIQPLRGSRRVCLLISKGSPRERAWLQAGAQVGGCSGWCAPGARQAEAVLAAREKVLRFTGMMPTRCFHPRHLLPLPSVVCPSLSSDESKKSKTREHHLLTCIKMLPMHVSWESAILNNN